VPEAALDPQLPICDSHFHFYPEGSAVHPPYLPGEFVRDITSGHAIVATCHVETSGSAYRVDGPIELRPVGETEWVASAPAEARIEGIIALADLMLGDAVEPVLDEHERAAGGRLRGVRFRRNLYGLPPEPPADFFGETAVRAAAAALERRRLVLELGTTFYLLPSLTAFVRTMPGLPVVVDHLGWSAPGGDHGAALERWRVSVRELAECENVFVKTSGIGRPGVVDPSAFGSPPASEEIAARCGPQVRFVIEAFGSRRCLFGSNFPWDAYLCEYATLWNAYKRIAAEASDGEKADLFHDTAVRLFRLRG